MQSILDIDINKVLKDQKTNVVKTGLLKKEGMYNDITLCSYVCLHPLKLFWFSILCVINNFPPTLAFIWLVTIGRVRICKLHVIANI